MELKEELAKGNVATEKWKSGLAGSVRSMSAYQRSLTNNIKSNGTNNDNRYKICNI